MELAVLIGLQAKAAGDAGIMLHTIIGDPLDTSAKKRLAFWFSKVDIKLAVVFESSVFAMARTH